MDGDRDGAGDAKKKRLKRRHAPGDEANKKPQRKVSKADTGAAGSAATVAAAAPAAAHDSECADSTSSANGDTALGASTAAVAEENATSRTPVQLPAGMPRRWIEVSGRVRVQVDVEEAVSPRRLVLRMGTEEGSETKLLFGGTWTIELQELGSGSPAAAGGGGGKRRRGGNKGRGDGGGGSAPTKRARTRVTITERGFVASGTLRFVATFIMGLSATMDRYLGALGSLVPLDYEEADDEPSPASVASAAAARGASRSGSSKRKVE